MLRIIQPGPAEEVAFISAPRDWLLFWAVILTCKGILFDLDGVLIDSTPAVARVWARWAITHGISPDLAIAQAHGRRSIETIRAIAPHLNAEKENVWVEQMEIEDSDGVIALPGAARLLASLPQDRFAIVTSATARLARARLGYAGLPLPQNLVTAGDVTQGKPSPEPYLRGAELLRLEGRDCVVFEDAPAGIVSAYSAGMQVVAIPTTYPVAKLSGANEIVPSLQDVQIQVLEDSLRLSFDSATSPEHPGR